mmetsp:Transcript_20653/g.33303  ORF Transcript_20653/g.33303 Transcript_20653/m.33303 type:complete len:152 (-) Transcript_20653:346-801(-)
MCDISSSQAFSFTTSCLLIHPCEGTSLPLKISYDDDVKSDEIQMNVGETKIVAPDSSSTSDIVRHDLVFLSTFSSDCKSNISNLGECRMPHSRCPEHLVYSSKPNWNISGFEEQSVVNSCWMTLLSLSNTHFPLCARFYCTDYRHSDMIYI